MLSICSHIVDLGSIYINSLADIAVLTTIQYMHRTEVSSQGLAQCSTSGLDVTSHSSGLLVQNHYKRSLTIYRAVFRGF